MIHLFKLTNYIIYKYIKFFYNNFIKFHTSILKYLLYSNILKNGIGSKLMNMIKDEAKNKSIKKLFVDTYAFQAQEFYKKHDFNVIGIVPEYLLGYDRIFMRKDI